MVDPVKDQGPCGFLNINKPAGCTSRDVVNQVQRLIGRKIRIGHAGTLDPMATGVLLICLGRATKLVPVIHEFPKTYVAEFVLGQTSNTDDSTGEIVHVTDVDAPDQDAVRQALHQQIGTLMQTPPAFSAVKLQGRRAYQAARRGEIVTIQPRPVTVHAIDVVEYLFPRLSVRIVCSSGTYIRSIARDLGTQLGVGGLMSGLVRTEIGPFHSGDSNPVDALGVNWDEFVLPAMSLFRNQPQHILSEADIQLLRNGKRLILNSEHDRLIAVADQGQFAAVLQRESESYRATINWVPAWFQ